MIADSVEASLRAVRVHVRKEGAWIISRRGVHSRREPTAENHGGPVCCLDRRIRGFEICCVGSGVRLGCPVDVLFVPDLEKLDTLAGVSRRDRSCPGGKCGRGCRLGKLASVRAGHSGPRRATVDNQVGGKASLSNGSKSLIYRRPDVTAPRPVRLSPVPVSLEPHRGNPQSLHGLKLLHLYGRRLAQEGGIRDATESAARRRRSDRT